MVRHGSRADDERLAGQQGQCQRRGAAHRGASEGEAVEQLTHHAERERPLEVVTAREADREAELAGALARHLEHRRLSDTRRAADQEDGSVTPSSGVQGIVDGAKRRLAL